MTDETPGLVAETGAAPESTSIADVLEAAPVAEKPAKPANEAAPEAKPEKPSEPFWYRKALKEKEDRAKALERENADLRQRSQQPAQPQQDDPEIRFLKAELRISERFARREHGNEMFEETRDWLAQRPDLEQWALGQEDPWEAAISTYRREKLADEIGNDPDKWRETERDRIRAELEAEMGQGGHAPQAMTGHRLPTPAAGVRSVAAKGGFAGPTPLNSVVGQRK